MMRARRPVFRREERMVFERISRLGDSLRRAVNNLTEGYRGRSRHAIAEDAARVLAASQDEEDA
jgi:hypothetical protein